MQRLTPSPRLKKLPRKDNKKGSEKKYRASEGGIHGDDDTIKFDNLALNPRVKVYDSKLEENKYDDKHDDFQ